VTKSLAESNLSKIFQHCETQQLQRKKQDYEIASIYEMRICA